MTPTPTEALTLWRLAAAGGEAWSKDVKPTLDRATRERLADAGLIEWAKRKAPEGRGAPIHVTLADGGWAWLAANLDADLTSRSPAGTVVLTLLLRGLKRHMERTDASLADILSAPPASAPALPLAFDGDANGRASAPSADLPARIASAYYALSDGRPNVRVRLADLRRRLSDVPREELDRELSDIQVRGEAALYSLDSQAEIGPEDREAAYRTPLGEERYVIYLGGRGS